MRALVVEESMFGNTESIARAIVDGLKEAGAEVELWRVRDAGGDVDGYDLVVVGGPTHAFGMSRVSTRADAAKKGADQVSADAIGIREWIEGLAPSPGVAVATFDTKVRRPRVPGSAARAARKRLRAKGFRAADPSMTFWVEGVDGPLVDGEVGRARRWAMELAAGIESHRVVPD